MATQANLDLAQTLYIAYYGRPADRSGLNFWAEKIEADGVESVLADFGTSAEFDARFGDLTNEQLVNNLYNQLFGRDAELEGLEFWAGKLQSGELNLAEIAYEIANGAQDGEGGAPDAATLAAKLAAANAFTAAIDTTEEVVGYQGDAAADAGREFLAGVEAGDEVTAEEAQASLNAVISANNPGVTLTLTEGLEALQAATSAKAAFLEENETTEAAINDNLDALETDLATARATVSDRVLNARLQDAQDAVAAARANIDSVPGLTSAVATLEDAQDTLAAAQETRADAVANVAGARANFETRNPAANIEYAGYEVSVDGALVIELNDSGTLVVTEAGAQVDGINTLLAAHQALQAADADLAAAEAAVESAQAAVNELDLTAAAVELQEARDQAQAALQAHVRANGSTEALETQLADAQAALAESVADSEAVIAAQAAVEDAQAALDTRAELEGAVDAAETALDAHVAEFGATDALVTARDEAQTALGDREALVQDVEGAQAAVDARADLVQDVADAEALVEQRDALAATVQELTDAQDARADLRIDVTNAQTNVDDFATESTAFTDAQADLTDFNALVTTYESALAAYNADNVDATAQADLVNAYTALSGAYTTSDEASVTLTDATATDAAAIAGAEATITTDIDEEVTALESAIDTAAADLFVETTVDVSLDRTADYAAAITAEGAARDTALNEAESALDAHIDEFGSDAQLAADLAQAQLALETFDAENGDVSQALSDAEGALQTDIDDNGDDAALQAALNNAQNALIAAQVEVSDEELEQALANAKALVEVREGLEGDLDAAQTALNEDITANGSTEALETALTDAQAALDAAISDGDPDLVAQVEALQATLAERAELQAAADDAQAEFEAAAATNPRVDTLETALAAEETAQDAVDVRTEMIAEVEAAQALADTLEELNAGIEGAEEAIEELGFELPITAEDSVFGTAGDDIFLFAGEDATISGFNATGDDLLYVGAGFTRTDLESDIDLTATRQGSADTLEVFFQQDGNNAVLSFEEVAFAGNATGNFEGNVITLTGVNVDNLALNAEGFITIA